MRTIDQVRLSSVFPALSMRICATIVFVEKLANPELSVFESCVVCDRDRCLQDVRTEGL